MMKVPSYFLLLLFLSACSSINNPVIYYKHFDFDKVDTYQFYSTESSFFETQNLSYAQRSRIELAIEKSLESQKFNYSTHGKADMVVAYYLLKNKRQEYLAYNKLVLFCAHCLKANAWLSAGNDWRLYENGLIIDLIDPHTNRTVWRSIYPLELDIEDNSQERNSTIKSAVNSMLSQYPKNIISQQ